MIIKGTNGVDLTKAYAAQQQRTCDINSEKQSAGNKANRADILDISPEARQAQTYRAAMKELPEVREDLVMAIKKGIQAGTYKPDPEKIAGGILEDRLNTIGRR